MPHFFTMPLLAQLKKPEIPELTVPLYFVPIGIKLLVTDVFASVPAYRFAAFLPESVWAAIFITAGVLQFWATRRRSYLCRVLMLQISAAVWLIWAGGLIYQNNVGFGDIIWTISSISCFWAYYRLKHSPVGKR